MTLLKTSLTVLGSILQCETIVNQGLSAEQLAELSVDIAEHIIQRCNDKESKLNP